MVLKIDQNDLPVVIIDERHQNKSTKEIVSQLERKVYPTEHPT